MMFRWVDGTGVYFYSAIVVKEEEGRILVRFIEDGVERLLEREGEVVLTTQLSPGDQVHWVGTLGTVECLTFFM